VRDRDRVVRETVEKDGGSEDEWVRVQRGLAVGVLVGCLVWGLRPTRRCSSASAPNPSVFDSDIAIM
jgi:hypothetical protein